VDHNSTPRTKNLQVELRILKLRILEEIAEEFFKELNLVLLEREIKFFSTTTYI
jgi:hypothetical protein